MPVRSETRLDPILWPLDDGQPRSAGQATETVRILGRILHHLSTGEMAPAEAVEEVARTASLHLGFERTVFFALDHDGSVRGVTSYGVSPAMVRAVVEARSDMALLQEAILRGHAVHSEDVRADGSIPEHVIDQFGLTSLVATPLVAEQRLVGLLCADRGGDRFVPTADELIVLDAFASQAALGLRIADMVAERADAAVQTERWRVARRLHNTAAQLFYVIGTECARAKAGAQVDVAISRIEQLAACGGQEIRRAIDAAGATWCAEPHPNRVDGLLAELRDLYRCQIRATGDWQGFSAAEPVWDVLLGVVREAVTNAVKHGAARNVVLWLQRSEAVISLQVRDDGGSSLKTCAAGVAAASGFGLADLRRRLAPWGGRVTLRRNDDGGHTLHVKLTGSPR
jgi:signal transduction histidine kinase